MSQQSVNIVGALSRQARANPNATAVDTPIGNISFRELDILVWRAATALYRGGVRPGVVVALAFRNELALLVAMLATARVGATVFSIPQSAPDMQRKAMAAESGAAMLATDTQDLVIENLSAVTLDLRALALPSSAIDRQVEDKSPQAPWLLVTGSGTTGKPKLIPTSHEVAIRRLVLSPYIQKGDRVISLMSPDFGGTKSLYLQSICVGATIILFNRTQASPIALCNERKASFLFAAVTHAEQMLRMLPEDATHALGGLRSLVLAGSSVSDQLRRQVAKKLTSHLNVRYGSNEVGLVAEASGQDVLAHPGTVGRPLKGVEVRIVDAQGQPVPVGEIGLILVRSPGAIGGYRNDEEATRKAFIGSWFAPMDLGRLMPDGHLIYCGRADHMMIKNGINIYPAEIESVMTSHPAVRDAAVIPVNSPIHQDLPICAVSLHDGQTVTEQALLDYCVQNLGARAASAVLVQKEIPRNEQGKLIRAKLAEDIGARLGVKVVTKTTTE